MGISMRNSVLAVKVETTEGTPVVPAGATDYVAIQDDFTAAPAFAVLENAELTPSLGKRKAILGSQKPTVSFSHYLRHSGTEGTSPDYHQLLITAIGSETVAGTEYPLISGSTVSVLHFNTGIGANFQTGQGCLVKDGVNGYKIRAIDSVSGDNATLGFNLPNAPAASVKTGKCVLYKPIQSGYQTLTLWHYLGNGGAVQMIAGARVTQMTLKASAGTLINSAFTFDGIAFYVDPITIGATTCFLDFTDDTGTYACQVAQQTYQDPQDLAEAVQTAMQSTATTEPYTVSYDPIAGKFSIVGTGTLLSLLFSTGTNHTNTIATKLGFTATDKTGTAATTGYTSQNALTLTSPFTPTLDAADPLAAKGNEVMIGAATDYLVFDASDVEVSVQNTRQEIKSVCATSGVIGSQLTVRAVKIKLKALLKQYDSAKYSKYRENTTVKFQWSFGSLTGGNWVPGKCGYVYTPNVTISSWKVSNDNGLASLEAELTAFVDQTGSNEVYLGFL